MFFNLGPFEIVVLVLVGLVVFGPERLPELAKDAARRVKTLRELAQGARTQLRDELGPSLGDIDLRSLNPRVALQKAIFDDPDEAETWTGGDKAADVVTSRAEDKPVTRPIDPLGRAESAPYDSDAT